MIQFQDYQAENIAAKAAALKILTNEKLEKVIAAKDAPCFENTFLAFDRLMGEFNNEFSTIYLLSNTSSDENLQKACHEAVQDLSNFSDEISLNEALYLSLKAFSIHPDAADCQAVERRLIQKTIESFERNGFNLPKEERDILKTIRFELNELESAFQQNIAHHQFEMFISEEQTEGLPDYYKNDRRQADGTYKIALDYPSYMPFMRYAKSSELRKNLYIAYLNKAADKNIDVLKKVLILRKKMANLLGFKTYAAYAVENKMSKTTETVWNFENALKAKVRLKAQDDLAVLEKLQAEIFPENAHAPINAWDASYLGNILMETKYQIDSQEVMKYFEINAVYEGVFAICKKLFGIDVEKTNLPVWHEDVQTFLIKDGEKVLGHFYLDNFPRPRKYGHAACFGLAKEGNLYEKNALIAVALVCNFPPPTAERPSLLTFGQVETVFHEFGHLLHKVLSTSPFFSFTGTSVARDFVEVPSQLFENWAKNYDCLTLFAKHFETGEVFPREIFDKMEAARNVGSGLQTLQQILYGSFDFYLHDIYEPESEESTTEVFKRMQNEISLYRYVDNTHFEAAFGHLMGYSAAYYGYLWSLVYADDMQSVFEEQGMLNPEIGQKYRQTVLAKGNDIDAMDIIRQFLGREPNENAFLRSIGLEV